VVDDLVGMRYLAALLTRPGTYLTALELAGGVSASQLDTAPQAVLDHSARAA
jgi:hypothetical protein